MNVSKLRALYAMKQFKVPSVDTMSSYLNSWIAPSYINWGNLFYESNLDTTDYVRLRDYIVQFTKQYAELYYITDPIAI